MSEWEDQSLRDFVNSLGDTAVDLEPVGVQNQGEQAQADAEDASMTKKRRLLVVIGLVVLLILAGAGTVFYLNHSDALSDEYNSARNEYEQLREEALDKLAEAEKLAEECRSVIDDRAACEALDEAIRDTEEKSREIESTSPSQSAIDELKKATADLEPSLENLDTAYTSVEEKMGDSLGIYLQELIAEANQSGKSARALLNQYQGTLENERDGDDLNVLIERLNSTVDEARALLTGDNSGTLIAGAKPAEARDVTQALRHLIDDIADESSALRQSHQNFLDNQAREAEASQDSETSEPSPSTFASPSAASNEGTGDRTENNSQPSNH